METIEMTEMQQDIDQIRLIVQRSTAPSISISVSADQDLQFIESAPLSSSASSASSSGRSLKGLFGIVLNAIGSYMGFVVIQYLWGFYWILLDFMQNGTLWNSVEHSTIII